MRESVANSKNHLNFISKDGQNEERLFVVLGELYELTAIASNPPVYMLRRRIRENVCTRVDKHCDIIQLYCCNRLVNGLACFW